MILFAVGILSLLLQCIWGQQQVVRSIPELDKARAADACPTLLPSFAFQAAVDDPRFHDHDQSQPCRIAVVKTVTGGFDQFNFSRPVASSSSLCFFAFLDEQTARVSIPEHLLNDTCFKRPDCILPKIGQWRVVIITANMTSSLPTVFKKTRASRLMKMLSHRAFSTADFILFLDGKLHMRNVTAQAVEAFVLQNIAPDGGRAAWVSPLHPERRTVYEEGLEVCMLHLASDECVDQMEHYRAKGYPILAPPFLIEGQWHIRDLKAPASSQIGCAWMREYLSWNTYRDQLSFNFAVWAANLSAHWIPASVEINIVDSRVHSHGREPVPKPTRCRELLELTPLFGCTSSWDVVFLIA